MRVIEKSAHMVSSKNGITLHCRADLPQKTPKNGALWHTYSARVRVMVSLSYTSRREVRKDHKTGII